MRRFIIYAASISPVGTMGGNSKIALEIARNLPVHGWKVVVVVPRSKKATFTDNLDASVPIEYVEMEDYAGNDMYDIVSSGRHFCREVARAFATLGVGPEDTVYANCNFHYDILPLIREKRKRNFRYIATHYLFSPFVFENLIRKYRFPAFKYLLVWFYERFYFLRAKRWADAFVITNDDDRRHFPETWQQKVFAFYGGVNVAQIPGQTVLGARRDVVFCSRLHPQKGVEGLLEIWALVHEEMPQARLTLIGNGASDYEAMLRRKAERLGIADVVEWLGYVNNEAKYEIYCSAKVLAHATVYDNNGMVAAEALCSGLPVVMYDLPALRHVYVEGCVKIPYGDQKAYAAALVRELSGNDSARPTVEQVKSLRGKWDWQTRVLAFADWLQKLGCGH